MLHAVSIAVVLQLSNLSGAPDALVSRAQAEVVRVYAAAGVTVQWAPTESPIVSTRDVRSIRVVLLPVEAGDLRRTAETVVMGVAARTPHGNGAAYVYYRRVEEQAALHRAPLERVLACVMVHELGHLLGTRGHAPTGVMRACWRSSEFRLASDGALGFSSKDAAILRTLIHDQWLQQAEPIRHSRTAPIRVRQSSQEPVGAKIDVGC